MQIDHKDIPILFQVEASPRKSVKDFLLKRTNSTKQLNNYVPASTIEAFNRYANSRDAVIKASPITFEKPPP